MLSKNSNAVEKSPFLAPRRNKNLPGKNAVVAVEDVESKSSIAGCTFNLINAIIGAGILGMPYAMKQCTLAGGIFMIIAVVLITIKTLCLLVETAKHVDVTSYERLYEVCFGRPGYFFISLSMFVMSYGAMVSYLMIIKQTLPSLIGLTDSPLMVLFVSSLCIILPLSSLRDMANLSKTSTLSVMLDCVTVLIVVALSPVRESLSESDGIGNLLIRSPSVVSFFVGIGILSFAFVCQHSAFLIAGSLENPTQKRWSQSVTIALISCGILAIICGSVGFIGYREMTSGNILNNINSNTARACMCLCMCFVYPMESYVARHVMVVTFFKGRMAHEGDDHSVLARADRRITTTAVLYLSALIPAMFSKDLGSVLSLTGAVGGSALSYIGPGAAYLGVHGEEFLAMVNPSSWQNTFTWYLFLMPVWCQIAKTGSVYLHRHRLEQATLSPIPSRLGNVIHHNHLHDHDTEKLDLEKDYTTKLNEKGALLQRADSLPMSNGDLPKSQKMKILDPSFYGATNISAGNKGIGAAILAQKKHMVAGSDIVEEDPQDDPPTLTQFLMAIFFILFGVVALVAGVISICM